MKKDKCLLLRLKSLQFLETEKLVENFHNSKQAVVTSGYEDVDEDEGGAYMEGSVLNTHAGSSCLRRNEPGLACRTL